MGAYSEGLGLGGAEFGKLEGPTELGAQCACHRPRLDSEIIIFILRCFLLLLIQLSVSTKPRGRARASGPGRWRKGGNMWGSVEIRAWFIWKAGIPLDLSVQCAFYLK